MNFAQDLYVNAYGLAFVWDIAKEQLVKKDHGVSFTDALRVFVDPYGTPIVCNEPDANFALVGMGEDGVLYVAYCYRNGDRYIRLTTVRRADRAQKELYQLAICQAMGIAMPNKRKKQKK